MKVIANTSIDNGYVTDTYTEQYGKATFMLSYYQKIPKDLWFSNFNVETPSRGKGLGDKILDYAIDQAKGIIGGKGLLRLNVKTGSWIAKWYERKGFTKYHFEDGWDYMFMVLNS